MAIRSILAGFAILASLILTAQDDYPYPSLSPKGHVSQIVGNTTIKVSYERPSVRDREIFGSLVPWNKLWRTGAGYCTKIGFSLPVKVEGVDVAAGTYSVFSIPTNDSWTIIFNSDTTLYGTSGYNEENDVLRFKVESHKSSRTYEALTIDIDVIPDNARLYISWENTTVGFDVETSTESEIEKFIEEQLMTGRETNSNLYAGGAEYYYFMNRRLERGITLTRKALNLDPNNGWARSLQIKMLMKTGDVSGALDAVDAAIKALQSDSDISPEDLQREIEYYKKMRESISTGTDVD